MTVYIVSVHPTSTLQDSYVKGIFMTEEAAAEYAKTIRISSNRLNPQRLSIDEYKSVDHKDHAILTYVH